MEEIDGCHVASQEMRMRKIRSASPGVSTRVGKKDNMIGVLE
jgi:hypothetical protein